MGAKRSQGQPAESEPSASKKKKKRPVVEKKSDVKKDMKIETKNETKTETKKETKTETKKETKNEKETEDNPEEPIERVFLHGVQEVAPCPEVTPDDMEGVSSQESGVYNELRCAIHESGSSGPAQTLSLESVISRQPYIKMMQNLFGAYDESCFSQVPPVKIVTKAWEEAHMREPHPDERPCSMGINCECMFIDPALPFTCVEFRLPNEPLPNEQQLCVLCLRKLTQSMFYDIVYQGNRFNGVIQSHGNICDQPGEYARQVMLSCPIGGPVHCMPLPIVAHQRNRYSVVLNNVGVKHLKQHRVAWEDFRSTPPGP